LQRGALEGMGVALGRMVTARPLVEAGLLHVLGERYMPITEAYYLVYPPRSLEHEGLRIFRDWIRCEAEAYARGLADAAGRRAVAG